MLHDRPAIASVLPEAGMTLLVGMIAGFFVNLYADTEEADPNTDDGDVVDIAVAESLLSFSPEVFFVALLPPIIFNSGYHLRSGMKELHLGRSSNMTHPFVAIQSFSSGILLQFVFLHASEH